MSTALKERKQVILVFLASLALSLSVMAIGDVILKNHIHQKMVSYALASARECDGAANLVILDGRSSQVGSSAVRLVYLADGYVSIKGINTTEAAQWRKISEFILEPGTYTLTGLRDSSKHTAALRLHLEDAVGTAANYWQYDADVQFSITMRCEATLSVRVNQDAEVDLIARPAVYKDK